MRDYELKRGTGKSLEGDGLRKIAADVFGDVGTDGAKVIVSHGALEKMVAWTDGKKLFVDTTMKPGVPDHVATDTIKAYNAFLERATGLTAKERGKRAQAAAKKGAGGPRPSRRAHPGPQPPLPRRLSLLPSFPLSSSLPSSRRAALPRARRSASRRRPSGPRRCSRLPARRSGPSRGSRRPSPRRR